MEINVRKLLLTLGLVGLLAAGGYGLLRHFRPAPVPTALTPAAPVVVQPVNTKLNFADQSNQWDWQPAPCAEPLLTFITAPASITVTLTDPDRDAADLPLVVAYPDPQTPNASKAAAQCRQADAKGAVACLVSIRQAGTVAADRNIAAAVAIAYALQDYARPKTEAAYNARPAWAWENFQPVIVKEQSQWQSCLRLFPAK